MDPSKSFFRYTSAAHLLVTDEDAADFLQSQFTNDLRPFDTGQVTYGLWLNVKGKVVADSLVLCECEERFRLVSELGVSASIAEHLERHIIADDVELESQPPVGVLELPESGVIALGLPVPAVGSFIEHSGSCVVGRRNAVGLSVLIFDAEQLSECVGRLVDAGFAELTAEERGLLRIRAGIPAVPLEIGASDLPGEGAFENDGISFTKGCYLGQEVVARMHNVGKAQRQLFRVSGEGVAPVCPIDLLNEDGKRVGELRSAYPSGSRWEGAALLKTRFAGAGSQVAGESSAVRVDALIREGVCNGTK